jgi:glycosyltransferase involved in cell wall biosynthesis
MPFSPMPFIEQKYASEVQDVLNKYNLEVGYYYYPAQFWAHKNHVRILQALIILRDVHSYMPQVVFSGKDFGNLEYIKQFIKANNLDSQVKIIGFVPSEDMRDLYKNATAIVMPTYFGQTNLPPLEAWTLGIPLIYSTQLAEQACDAALLIDPDNSTELSDAMLLCANSEVRNQLIDAGNQRIKEIARLRMIAEETICSLLMKFEARRQCWDL